uniref:Uncharacterized protein n=1 Tax=Glossina austeni TaxID=7395 RepID=A0A1A9UJT6_GLOAU
MKLTRCLLRPKASQVLTAYLTQCNEPPWTSYFVKSPNSLPGESNFVVKRCEERSMGYGKLQLDT